MNNAASRAKHRTLIFSKLLIILCSYMHNTDLTNIITITVRVERDYVAPTIVQREGTSREEKGTWGMEERAGLLSFLSFHHGGAGVKCHAPNQWGGLFV